MTWARITNGHKAVVEGRRSLFARAAARHTVNKLPTMALLAALSFGLGTSQGFASSSLGESGTLHRAIGVSGVAVSSGGSRIAAPSSASAAVRRNVAPRPNFLQACSISTDTTACRSQEILAINNARHIESLPSLRLNLGAFIRLSAAQQVFVITNLERVVRHLPPVDAMTSQLNTAAAKGVAESTDPQFRGWTLSGQKVVTSWVSNWSGGLSTLGADYFWMYDDGIGFNVACKSIKSPGCWAHRDNLLGAAPTKSSCANYGGRPELLMGAAVEPDAYRGATGIAQLLVSSCGGLPHDTTLRWSTVQSVVAIATP